MRNKIKNNYFRAYEYVNDSTIIDHDPRIVNNFLDFFYKENLNPIYYNLKDISEFTEAYPNTLSKTHYKDELDLILVKKRFDFADYIRYAEDFKYINGFISEGFIKKSFFVIKQRNIKNYRILRRVYDLNNNDYTIEPTEEYPIVEL